MCGMLPFVNRMEKEPYMCCIQINPALLTSEKLFLVREAGMGKGSWPPLIILKFTMCMHWSFGFGKLVLNMDTYIKS